MEKAEQNARTFVAIFFLAATAGFYIYNKVSVADRLVSLDELSREEAGREVKGLGDPARMKLVPPLIRSLKSKEPTTRYYAARALGRLGPAAREAAPALLAMLNDTGLNSNVGAAAAEAFGQIAPDPVAGLTLALKDGDAEAGSNAASALGNFGPAAREAVPLLIGAAKAGNPGLRQSSIRALGKIGPEAKAAVPVLAGALKAGDPLSRSYAAEALERIGTPEALKALQKEGPGGY